MSKAELIVSEILRTYNQSDSEEFLKGVITTLINIKKSPFGDKKTSEEIIKLLNNFTTDEGLSDIWNNADSDSRKLIYRV